MSIIAELLRGGEETSRWRDAKLPEQRQFVLSITALT